MTCASLRMTDMPMPAHPLQKLKRPFPRAAFILLLDIRICYHNNMHIGIKNRLDSELSRLMKSGSDARLLKRVSPILFREIRDFTLRKGKRLRPILFIAGYLGFADKPAKNLYKCALSLELLHDFLIIHDDIIDKSDMRRGKPSMHKRLESYLPGNKNIKFSGEDLSIVVADIIYAMAIRAFMSIKEEPLRKERALEIFTETTMNTGGGEFIELLTGIKAIEKVTKRDIYKIYDLKTSFYSFSGPLSMGAMLAGTSRIEIDKLRKLGLHLGRAFQIKDDILGMFGDEREIGKSELTDLQEGRKTLLVWYAYNNSKPKDRSLIKTLLSKKRSCKNDLAKMREIFVSSGTLSYAKKEIRAQSVKARMFIDSSKMRKKYKDLLHNFSMELLKA